MAAEGAWDLSVSTPIGTIEAAVELARESGVLSGTARAAAAGVPVLGLTHGLAHLFVVFTTWRLSATSTAKAVAVIPGVGGLLALRRLRPVGSAEQPAEDPVPLGETAPSAPARRKCCAEH
jgi:hypothetical protein